MKKIISCLFLTVFLISGLMAKDRLFTFSTGISTGIPFYGSSQITYQNTSIPSQNRILIGTYANLNFNVLKQVTFYTGANFLADCIWNGREHSNHLNFDVPVGFKIYPNLGGFAFGIAYLFGFRADFYNTYATGKINTSPIWGNGFSLMVEYNFSKNSKYDFLPTFGFSWSFMPRGNYSYDNNLTFYTGLNF